MALAPPPQGAIRRGPANRSRPTGVLLWWGLERGWLEGALRHWWFWAVKVVALTKEQANCLKGLGYAV